MICVDCGKEFKDDSEKAVIECPHCKRQQTRSGRKVLTLEETRAMNFPYPTEKDL